MFSFLEVSHLASKMRLIAILAGGALGSLMHGDDQRLMEIYETDGFDSALLHVQSPEFAPTEASMLAAVKIRRPKIFQAQLEKLDPEGLKDESIARIVKSAVEHSNVSALKRLFQVTDKWLPYAFELAVDTSRLRVAISVYEMLKQSDEGFELPTDDENLILPYIRAFSHLSKEDLTQWLYVKEINDDDHLHQELLVLCLSYGLEERLFRYLFKYYRPSNLDHDRRLELLLALIEGGGPPHLLKVIVGRALDPTRLWLAYVDEEELDACMLEHGRLDMVLEMVRPEFAHDSEEKSHRRVERALEATAGSWPRGKRENCEIWEWLDKLMTGSIGMLPMLAHLSGEAPIGRAAAEIAFRILWHRGVIIEHLQTVSDESRQSSDSSIKNTHGI